MRRIQRPSLFPLAAPGLALLPLVLGACSSSSSGETADPDFLSRSTAYGTAAVSPIVVDGSTFIYLANEATSGQGDLNGDLDAIDDVASYVDILEREETLIGITAEHMTLVDGTVFLAVNEEDDGKDWDGDGNQDEDELSLVYWSLDAPAGTFLMSLDMDSTVPLLKTSATAVFAVRDQEPGAMGQTNLIALSAATPQLLTPVLSDAGGMAGLQVDLHGHDDGLVIVTLDEEDNGELNDDGDSDDDAILAFVDGTASGRMLISTGLAVDEPVVRAYSRGAGNWLIAFLVDESAQPETTEGMGFNNRDLFPTTWQHDGCPGLNDTDTDDEVLFFFDFLEFQADPMGRPIRNTGLVGNDRVVVVDGFVGVISEEDDDAGCDFNGDGDDEDRVLRWVDAELDPSVPLLPSRGLNESIALADPSDIPGGTLGVAELEDTFVVVVDEEADDRNYDDSLDDELLLGWLDPNGSDTWDFEHGPGGGADELFAGPTWMAESPDRERLLWGGREEIFDSNLNIPAAGNGIDDDMLDSVPLFSSIDEEDGRLTTPFIRIALDQTNAGLVIQDGVMFARFFEGDDSRDLNGDGDESDWVVGGSLTNVGGTPTAFIGGVAGIAGRDVVELDPFALNGIGAAYIANEFNDREDFNGDGDRDDLVVRYFRF